MAWGVPDAVLLPDGRVRIYWVEPSPQGGMATENIVSATSTDATGTVFVRDAGTRTTGGLRRLRGASRGARELARDHVDIS